MQKVGTDLDVQVEWAPFLLKRGIPEEGTPKPGGAGPHQVNARLKDVGLAAGINFTGMCDRFPNTLKAHELMTWALDKSGPQTQNNLQEVLFRHYFTDGRYPDVENLTSAAAEVGLPDAEAREVLTTRKYKDKVEKEMAEASQKGITGVPYFFFNGQPAFSGAQPPEAFVEALRRA